MEVYIVKEYIGYNNDARNSETLTFGVYSSIDNAIEAIEKYKCEDFCIDDSFSFDGSLFYSKTFISYEQDCVIILNLHKQPLIVDDNV